MKALDLFCGAGGATRGLQLAGFHVTGVDVKPQPRYVGDAFHQADALTFPLDGFDLIWASPPCQAHTALRKMWNARVHADLIPETRARLVQSGLPYVIENVPGSPLRAIVMLCGTSFGLGVEDAELRRHRFFEANFPILAPQCQHGALVVGVYGGHTRDRRRTIGVYGHSSDDAAAGHRARAITVTGNTAQTNVRRNELRRTFSVRQAQVAMGIDWMGMSGLSQAIPPAYSEHIGRYAIMALTPQAVAS